MILILEIGLDLTISSHLMYSFLRTFLWLLGQKYIKVNFELELVIAKKQRNKQTNKSKQNKTKQKSFIRKKEKNKKHNIVAAE